MNRKQYERECSRIKREYKGRDSKKKLILLRLDTKYEYHQYLDQYKEVPSVPGLSCKSICPLKAQQATREVLDVLQTIPDTGNYSNIRFYINKPYYSRSGNDPFPCYSWMHPDVKEICELVASSLSEPLDLDRLNVIIRIYKTGDVLGFHSDRKEFGEDIYGVVIHNNSKNSDGLILVNKDTKQYYQVDETQPISWHLTGKSRWNWIHGYSNSDLGSGSVQRISITYRYYQYTKQIPNIQNPIQP